MNWRDELRQTMDEDQARGVKAAEARAAAQDRVAIQQRQARALLEGPIDDGITLVRDALAPYHRKVATGLTREVANQGEAGVGVMLERFGRDDLRLAIVVDWGGEALRLRLVDETGHGAVPFPATAVGLTADEVAAAISAAYRASLARDPAQTWGERTR